MEKLKVLFVCIYNSARSQMAEVFLNRMAGDRFEAQSAGLEPGVLNPLVIAAMAELGIDISGNSTKSVASLIQQGLEYDLVVTVCDGASAERCPVFPGRAAERLHWEFDDPSSASGTESERLAVARRVRDEIKSTIEQFISTY